MILAALLVSCVRRDASGSWAAPLDTPASAFDTALESVRGGTESSVHVGSFVIERASDGGVRVARDSSLRGPPEGDAWMATKLRSRYAADSDLKSGDVQVTAAAGVVTLHGAVRSSYEASRAIREAFETSGVVAVTSALRYPASANQASRN